MSDAVREVARKLGVKRTMPTLQEMTDEEIARIRDEQKRKLEERWS